MRTICSKKSDLVGNVESLRTGSKKEPIQRIWLTWTLESPSLGCSKTSERSISGNCTTGVPLMVDYNPILCRLGQVIRKNLCSLYQDEEVKQVFNPAPFV